MPRASKETVAWHLLNDIISYHKLHYLEGDLPHYMEGISFKKKYDDRIHSLDVCKHLFCLYRVKYSITNNEVRGYVAMYWGRLVYIKKVIFWDQEGFKIYGYWVESVTFEVA